MGNGCKQPLLRLLGVSAFLWFFFLHGRGRYANGFVSLSLQQQRHLYSSLRQGSILGDEVLKTSSIETERNIPRDKLLSDLRSQTLSAHHILYPYIVDSDDTLTPTSIYTALENMRKAVETLSMMVDQQTSLREPQLLRIEHTIGGCRDVLSWLRAQVYVDDNTDMIYFNTEQREVAGLGIALRASGGVSWPDSLPPRAVWYGGARFDSNKTGPRDDDWDSFWTKENPDSYWVLPSVELVHMKQDRTVFLSVHCLLDAENLKQLQNLLHQLRGLTAPRIESSLPPILSRDESPVDFYENAVESTLDALQQRDGNVTKVVLARSQTLRFGQRFQALDVVARSKYCSNDEGMLFLLQPDSSTAFVGCTPETLFAIRENTLTTEALAGTRPRGASEVDDRELLQDLLESPKERRENRITADFIENILDALGHACSTNWTSTFGIRRLRHVQHICAQYTMPLGTPELSTWEIARNLLASLHPTPAVGGVPKGEALRFIREREGIDRGLYAGPIGYIGNTDTCLGVGIRSALYKDSATTTALKVYAGSGLVEGSTLLGEWTEINSKLMVMSSLFPQSPLTLRSAPTPNVAWATAFCEELVRNGVSQFYICPGSRSTPLTVALAKMQISCTSVHDERAAGFRAVGYARGTGRPAAVVTSSGTAVANLYPAVVEAGTDGLPMILLTADRPYENRATGANQAIDQVKIFSSEYVHWFRDILPPSDTVPVSLALSDACQAVTLSQELRGPVHINVQFRENLAPDAGPIRNDNREGSLTQFDGKLFTDVPGFKRWSEGGMPWIRPYTLNDVAPAAIHDLASLIESSKRGIIVVGNIRKSKEGGGEDIEGYVELISDFAKAIGFPIVAGVQSARLRFISSAVIPFAEHLLKNENVAKHLRTDLIIQLGAPLVSTAVPSMAVSSLKQSSGSPKHVFIHPHMPAERADPELTVTHRIDARIDSVLVPTMKLLAERDILDDCSSELVSLIDIGGRIAAEIEGIVEMSSRLVTEGLENHTATLTEPELVLALSNAIETSDHDVSLFLSNSMPIRDAESFLYPLQGVESRKARLLSVGSNRGASGIDGIVSSALGFSESTKLPTTLLIGDLATLHDISSLHSLSNSSSTTHPLTTIVVNNDGGGIFSFLPVASHGRAVRFDEFFGTPTSSFQFVEGGKSFGLDSHSASSREEFEGLYKTSTTKRENSLIEAVVVGRSDNVAVHQRINAAVNDLIDEIVGIDLSGRGQGFQNKVHVESISGHTTETTNNLLLLHGWMGDSSEWEDVVVELKTALSEEWKILVVDLPGHGKSPWLGFSSVHDKQHSLGSNFDDENEFSVSAIAETVIASVSEYGIKKLDALVGYSAGGRIGLAIKKICSENSDCNIVDDNTSIVLLGSYPGDVDKPGTYGDLGQQRREINESLVQQLRSIYDKSTLRASAVEKESLFCEFLYRWYKKPLWGSLNSSEEFGTLMKRRARSLMERGRDISSFLRNAAPSNDNSWKLLRNQNSLFVAGSEDIKYRNIGKALHAANKTQYCEVSGAGHSLLVQAPSRVGRIVAKFLEGTNSTEVDSLTSEVELRNENSQSRTTLPERPERLSPKKPLWSQSLDMMASIETLTMQEFSISLVDPYAQKSPFGIGWGAQASAQMSHQVGNRNGFLIQLECRNGLYVGVGEASPLFGVHHESLEDVRTQLLTIQACMKKCASSCTLEFNAEQVLSMNGELARVVDELLTFCGIESAFPTVRFGLEMAILTMSSHLTGIPLHQTFGDGGRSKLPTNGLLTRTKASQQSAGAKVQRTFPSIKVKVGHQDLEKDKAGVLRAYQLVDRVTARIRADANQAWNESQAIEFATALEGLDVHAREKLEFIEEPLQPVVNKNGAWSFSEQVVALERSYFQTGIQYALDESLVSLANSSAWNYDLILQQLLDIYANSTRGCAAFILKPSLLGADLSLRIARFCRAELGIGAVFSSCFESGIGLAHIALLGLAADQIPTTGRTFPHGVGTFQMLSEDTMVPAYATYVDEFGFLQVSSVSRALFGLSLDDVNSFSRSPRSRSITESSSSTYESATATSKNGKEISVVSGIRLPFSSETAASRFVDLPTVSRWSPWVSNVEYKGVSVFDCVLNLSQIAWSTVPRPKVNGLSSLEGSL